MTQRPPDPNFTTSSKIKIKVYGEPYLFKCYFYYGQDKSYIRQYCTEKFIECRVVDNHIVMNEPLELEGYTPDNTPPKVKKLSKIKLPKYETTEIQQIVAGTWK